MPYSRGTVVEVGWPHSDGEGASTHPALVVQCERATHVPSDQYVLALITSRTTHMGGPCVFVRANDPDGQAAGFTKDSFIVLDVLETVKAAKILRIRGTFPRMEKVDKQLRIALRLPDQAPAAPTAPVPGNR